LIRILFAPFLISLWVAFSGAPVHAAACQGSDLIAKMPADKRAALLARAAAYPFSKGLLWRARRGQTDITLFGTFHIFDAAAARMMRRLTPIIAASDVVFLEATPVEIAKLKAYMGKHPEVLFRPDGPTLPEVLSAQNWQALSKAMKKRHIPPFLASKMSPWMVSATLEMPYCAQQQQKAGRKGLDFQIMAAATARGVKMRPLEPFDTVFRIFDAFTFAEQIDAIRSAISKTSSANDRLATLRAQYLAQNVRVIWEMSRNDPTSPPGTDPAKAARMVEKQMKKTEDILLNNRNKAWIKRLLKQAKGKKVMVAVGALHLSGKKGLLSLLQNADFKITRLPIGG